MSFRLILLNSNEKCEYCNHIDEVKCGCQSGECNCGCIIDQEDIINPLIDRVVMAKSDIIY